MKALKNSFLLYLLPSLLGCTLHAGPAVRREGRTTQNGQQYALFYPDNLSVRVVTNRPKKEDALYQLSVAAAYTDLDTDEALDVLVDNGHVRQATATGGFLDGVLTLVGDTPVIARIANGASPPRAQLERVRRRHGTLLLQELLVYPGKNQRGPGGSLFQRRALAERADHRFALVESESDQLTRHQFAQDLVELGAHNAVYLDMGDWDEGWYKTGSKVLKLGHRRTATAQQSNGLVFATPSAVPAPN